ncbi:BspA family leucine-rich repeat surface protein [bacterium]|nr:BspA family leucine-rich repeat surface protein [bacterium]
MFHNCKSLSDISALEKRDVSNVNNMSDLFYETDLNDISPLKNWNIKNVKNIS